MSRLQGAGQEVSLEKPPRLSARRHVLTKADALTRGGSSRLKNGRR
jgi:hypothetical protein